VLKRIGALRRPIGYSPGHCTPNEGGCFIGAIAAFAGKKSPYWGYLLSSFKVLVKSLVGEVIRA